LKKILIANRGEIAVRVIRTCREMGLATVAVYSACDRNALHVRMADEACAIGPDRASESYLRVDKLLDAAAATGADAVHPGYGFLSENPDFAEACATAGLTFIGPGSRAMRALGNKTDARATAAAAGVQVVPGSSAPLPPGAGTSELEAAARGIGYPILVKAVAGGGGKGMRTVHAPAELADAVRAASSEAESSFGDGRVYLERRLEDPRHIEVQLLADLHGTVVAFVERECSIQRRHQKLIEETPSPAVSPELRSQLIAAAAAIGRAAGYTSAGTVEFLVDTAGGFYFLEMNTRLQVEHPITEAVTGLDFVRAQIEIARGVELAAIMADRKSGTAPAGHAIEARIYAEDPDDGFVPSPGAITGLREPGGPGVRVDSGVFEGWTVPATYDPLLSKVIAWAPDRRGAIARMVRALTEYDIRGVRTTIEFCRDVIGSPEFAAGGLHTSSLDGIVAERSRKGTAADGDGEEYAAITAALWSIASRPLASSGDGSTETMWTQRARMENLR
jgi:acetyl-CoA carboxylase, biotin carboxylase subunit